MEGDSIYKYWGKADKDNNYHLLVYHCLDVSAVGKVWLEKSPSFVKRASKAAGLSTTAFTEWFLYFLALHDVGKFDVRFQNLRSDLLLKLQGKKTDLLYSPRHDQKGFEYWREVLCPVLCSTISNNEDEIDILREWFSIIAPVVMGHHGTPPKSDFSVKLGNRDIELVTHFSSSILDFFVSLASREELKKLSINDGELFESVEMSFRFFSWQLAGLTTLCDWIASGDEAFTFENKEISFSQYFKNTYKNANDALKKTEAVSTPIASQSGMQYLFPQFTNLTPLQKFCDSVNVSSDPQLWILEDVAGAGKTEAALTLASRILGAGGGTGSFVALPTMATSNAMYERMADVYHLLYEHGTKPTLSLSHGSRHHSETFSNSYKNNFADLPQSGTLFNTDIDEGMAHCSQWLADNSKKALLSDVGVGTIDQILMAGLPVRYQSLRAFGMAQKVLIIDEVHSFDAYMLRLLENVITVQASFGCSVILLSATLPFSVRTKFCNAFSDGLGIESDSLQKEDIFPLVTSVTQHGICEDGVETRSTVAREVEVYFCEDIEMVYALIDKSVEAGKCICWIRNTISDVTESFTNLKSQGINNLDMFHSRFALKDRLDIEKRVLSRFGKNSTEKERRGQVLIASQVVEQSLDLDFDVMISDLAPIDLLIQRAGRLHRHEKGVRDKPIFYVHTPKDTKEPTAKWFSDSFPKASFVYKDVALLWRTKEILKKQKRFKMPEEARILLESVYGGDTNIITPPIFDNAENESWGKMMSDKAMANLNKLDFTQGYSTDSSYKWTEDEGTPTRLSDKTNKLYLCQWINGSIKPIYSDSDYSWDLSVLSLRAYSLASIEYSDEINIAIEELKKQRRFQYDSLFLVFEGNNMELLGKDESKKEVIVQYSSVDGLIVNKVSDID